MSTPNASPIRLGAQPVVGAGPEKPNPGRDGATTWNASAGSPPCARGSVSGPTTSRNSAIDPGQPWLRTSGSASGSGERTCAAWIGVPSISVSSCGQAFSRASQVRQS